jgi:hypothetical protein
MSPVLTLRARSPRILEVVAQSRNHRTETRRERTAIIYERAARASTGFTAKSIKFTLCVPAKAL